MQVQVCRNVRPLFRKAIAGMLGDTDGVVVAVVAAVEVVVVAAEVVVQVRAGKVGSEHGPLQRLF